MKQKGYWFLVIIVFVVGVWLRVHQLEQRPLHADESTNARMVAYSCEAGFHYNPKHFHGPWLFYLGRLSAEMAGCNTWQTLEIIHLRAVTVLAGILLMLWWILYRSLMGKWTALVGLSLIATSPLLIYYDRMFIHESWMNCFIALMFFSGWSWFRSYKNIQAVICGISIGLLCCTKETAIMSCISYGLALGIIYYVRSEKSLENIRFGGTMRKGILWSGGVALLVIVMMYTNGFTYWRGLIDLLKSFFVYEIVEGHEKRAAYYFNLMISPKQLGRYYWSEGLVLILAMLTTGILCFKKQVCRNYVLLFLIITTLAHILFYQLISYKVPWLLLVPWLHVVFLASISTGSVFLILQGLRRKLLLISLGVVIGYQSYQSFILINQGEKNNRNPYAYVPTVQQAVELPILIQKLGKLKKESIIYVLGSNYWPMPWYLKSIDGIRYYDSLKLFAERPDIILVAEVGDQENLNLLHESYVPVVWGLRWESPIYLLIDSSLWSAYLKSHE